MLTGFKSNEHSTTKAALVKKMGEQQDKQTKKKGAKINPNRTDKAGRTKIFYATTSGHVERVQQLVESGANVNFVDNAGWTPLHEAALKGEYAIAKYLIECGAKLDVQGFGQDTPLHDAAVNGSAAIVQLLVDAGANVFALNERKERPIDLCENAPDARHILQQKMDALDKLIARDENGQTSLHRACVEANLEKAAKLIQQGANVNAHDNKRHATPLYLVCHDPKYKPVLLDMVKLLVNKSAVVDISDNQGNTPLHEASRLGHTELVEYLVTQANADVYIENNKQQTAYDAAASHPPVRQILTARMDEVRLEKVASNALDEIAVRTAKKKEPERQLTREERKIQNYMKQFASMNNNHHQDEHIQEDPKPKRQDSPQLTPQRQKSPSAVVKKKKGGRPPKARTPQKSATPESVKSNTSMARLDPFKKDGCGRTQLHKYALKGSETNVAQLLQLGADPNAADHAGWTPLHEAALEGHVDTVKLLLDHNAEINIKGGANMDTPLHDAVENNHCDVVELLLERGADPFARNAKGAEPMDVAVEKKHDDIVLVLEATNPVSRKKSALQKKKRKDVHMASHTGKAKRKAKRKAPSSSCIYFIAIYRR
jgi:ankyrin repeat protein